MAQFNNEIFFAVLFTTVLVLLLVIGIALAFLITGKQRIKQQMQLTQARLEFEKELRKVENEVSEQLMSRFAQELHDNIGNQLTGVHYIIENEKLDKPSNVGAFNSIEIYLNEAREQLRLLSRTLNYDYLVSAGLVASIQAEVDKLRLLKRFAVIWNYDKDVTGLDKNQELVTFRIFQEIIQNALRHSGAKNLTISLTTKEAFCLRVQDDGKGFDKQEVFTSSKASGLLNIMKRADLVGLSCTLETASGKGCLFILKKVITLN